MPNDDWETPTEIIEMARTVMGSIDLDPASSEQAQRHVKALKYYTIQDDGLKAEWGNGSIWLNPPYSQPACAAFVSRLVSEKKGKGGKAILLVNNCTETRWFQHALVHCRAVCFPAKRISFLAGGNVCKNNRQGQTVFYFGRCGSKFADVFGAIGTVLPVGG